MFGSSLIFLVLGFLVYLFVQYRSYTGDPTLDIYYPRDNEVLETDVLDVTGKADLDSEVFINNQQIIVNPDGSFVTSLKLKEGLNTISIRAVNQLDRETEKIKTIIFRPKKEVIVPVIEESSESTQSDSDFL